MTSRRLKLPWRIKKNITPSADSVSSEFPSADKDEDLWYLAFQQVVDRDPALVRPRAFRYDQCSYGRLTLTFKGEKYAKALEKSRRSSDVLTRGIQSKHDTSSKKPQYEVLRATVEVQLAAFEQDHRKPSNFQDIIAVINGLKGFVTLAASQEPHAAVAWAALSLLLPVVLPYPLGLPCSNQDAS
jgi:hypothetical protein